MSLNEKFDAAANAIRSMKGHPTDEELLELYGLYKQATAGDCGPQPSSADAKATAKFGAWMAKKGLNQDAAKDAYVTYANTLITKY